MSNSRKGGGTILFHGMVCAGKGRLKVSAAVEGLVYGPW